MKAKIDAGNNLTPEEAALHTSTTHARVAEIEEKALNRLRGINGKTVAHDDELWREAVEQLHEALGTDPETVLKMWQNPKFCIAAVRQDGRLLEFVPENLKARVEKAVWRINLRDNILKNTRNHDYDRIIADCTEAVTLYPDNLEYIKTRGSAYHHKGDFDHAIADYTEVIRHNPDDSSYFNFRGMAYSGKGDMDLAIADYTEAIRLYPDNWPYFSNRGRAYSRKGDHDRADADYAEAARLSGKRKPHTGTESGKYLNK